jgi:hypothetical protein
MKDKFKKLINNARKITLTDEERFSAKRILELHIENHPVRNGRKTSLKYERSKIKSILTFKFMPLILALLFALGGGTALAANNSLPGEFLYPMKVGFNEQTRGILALTKDAKAEYQSDLVAERVEEIQKLVVKNNELSTDVREEVGENFERYMEKALELIRQLEASGDFEAATEVSSHLEAILNAHQDLINEISDKNETSRLNLEDILSRVDDRLKTVEGVREEAEDHIESSDENDESGNDSAKLKNAAKVKLSQSEQAIKKAKDLLLENELVLGDNLKSDIESVIKEAEDAHAKGVGELSKGNSADAFKYFQDSLRLTHQVKTMVKSWVPMMESSCGDSDKDGDYDDCRAADDKEDTQDKEDDANDEDAEDAIGDVEGEGELDEDSEIHRGSEGGQE